MSRKEIRKFKRKRRCKFFTQPYKNGKTRERARRYYFGSKNDK